MNAQWMTYVLHPSVATLWATPDLPVLGEKAREVLLDLYIGETQAVAASGFIEEVATALLQDPELLRYKPPLVDTPITVLAPLIRHLDEAGVLRLLPTSRLADAMARIASAYGIGSYDATLLYFSISRTAPLLVSDRINPDLIEALRRAVDDSRRLTIDRQDVLVGEPNPLRIVWLSEYPKRWQ